MEPDRRFVSSLYFDSIYHWNFFATLPNGEATRSMGVTFHIVFLVLEGWAGLFSKSN
ncbi:hypothetical protein LEP1GSC046_3132 [Leptospira kirschneri serovar Bim str. 1051]|nr:hypothetical protein [Leptospira kirschneri]EMK18424.1 hypothetical protein LEP1GSC042_3708 [Leptospira kirschneri serovar Bim str. PUO 1247]EMN03236.1 hypothetical protein LEP1GSC046_3132 [Leptospira kirschneri serovar Bim str. 1051]